MLKRARFRELSIKALKAANTLAAQNVFDYAWPTNLRTNPAICVNWGRDVKTSNGREVANFTSIFTLRLDIRIQGSSMADALSKMDTLLEQVEIAILTDYDLNLLLQHFPHVDTVNTTDSESENFIATAICDIAMETFELFPPKNPPDLQSINIEIDTQNPFDAEGTYPNNPLFQEVPSPAPRKSGPDGRLEGIVRKDNLSS